MTNPHPSERYSFINDKNPREIVLLRGSGCKWRRCRFCNYHLDFSSDQAANDALNLSVLSHVTGKSNVLEMINSGSFCDLSETTLAEVIHVCKAHSIKRLHVECHWQDRAAIAPFRTRLASHDIELRVKGGIETFDGDFRERVFERICINLMIDNGTPVKRSENVVNLFMNKIYPSVKDNPRVDVLINNTDFGVG